VPTLIRLVVALLFLVGLGYAGMFALAVFVDPGQKQVTVNIPSRTFANIKPEPEPSAAPAADDASQPPSVPNESAPE
jgi:hypothetical protein